MSDVADLRGWNNEITFIIQPMSYCTEKIIILKLLLLKGRSSGRTVYTSGRTVYTSGRTVHTSGRTVYTSGRTVYVIGVKKQRT